MPSQNRFLDARGMLVSEQCWEASGMQVSALHWDASGMQMVQCAALLSEPLWDASGLQMSELFSDASGMQVKKCWRTVLTRRFGMQEGERAQVTLQLPECPTPGPDVATPASGRAFLRQNLVQGLVPGLFARACFPAHRPVLPGPSGMQVIALVWDTLVGCKWCHVGHCFVMQVTEPLWTPVGCK